MTACGMMMSTPALRPHEWGPAGAVQALQDWGVQLLGQPAWGWTAEVCDALHLQGGGSTRGGGGGTCEGHTASSNMLQQQ